jgi:hypothetical protein
VCDGFGAFKGAARQIITREVATYESIGMSFSVYKLLIGLK